MKQIASSPRQLLLLALSLFLLVSCADEGIIDESPRVTTPEPQELVTSTLYGRVIDKQDQPIADASVTYKSGLAPQQVRTDELGYFTIPNTDNKGRAAFISITSPGKFEAFRRFSLLADRTNYTEVKMMERSIIGTIDAAIGGQVNHASGASVDLPAGGIITSQNTTYQGDVDVAMTWIDPSLDDLAQRMVGDLSGIDEDGNTRSLSTMGMLQVELIGEGGELLNLGEGESATLTFPIPQELMASATPMIPLWSYDENAGTWMQEGNAVLEGSNYIGEASHFSSWNVDFMTDPIEITGRVVWPTEDDNGEESETGGTYLQVYVCSELIGRKGGWLCDDGSFRFYNFPKDERFQLKVTDKCGNNIFQESYGPFSTDEDLGTISVGGDNSSLVHISGNAITCDGDPVSNGVVLISQGENLDKFPLNDDGTFDIGYAYCPDIVIGVEIVDLDANQISAELIVMPGETSAMFSDISACEELETFIIFTIEGIDTISLFTENYIFLPSTDPADIEIYTMIHGDETTTERSFLFSVFSLPLDFEMNPEMSLADVVFDDFAYVGGDLSCVKGALRTMTVTFETFDNRVGGIARGTFEGEISCDEEGGNNNVTGRISGSFKVPFREI